MIERCKLRLENLLHSIFFTLIHVHFLSFPRRRAYKREENESDNKCGMAVSREIWRYIVHSGERERKKHFQLEQMVISLSESAKER